MLCRYASQLNSCIFDRALTGLESFASASAEADKELEKRRSAEADVAPGTSALWFEAEKTQQKYSSNHSLSHELGSESVNERASKRVSAVERLSETSNAGQANKRAVQANKRSDERVAQYSSLDSWIFWTIVFRTVLC